MVSTNYGAGFLSRMGAGACLTMGWVVSRGERDLAAVDGGVTLKRCPPYLVDAILDMCNINEDVDLVSGGE